MVAVLKLNQSNDMDAVEDKVDEKVVFPQFAGTVVKPELTK